MASSSERGVLDPRSWLLVVLTVALAAITTEYPYNDRVNYFLAPESVAVVGLGVLLFAGVVHALGLRNARALLGDWRIWAGTLLLANWYAAAIAVPDASPLHTVLAPIFGLMFVYYLPWILFGGGSLLFFPGFTLFCFALVALAVAIYDRQNRGRVDGEEAEPTRA